MPERFGNERDTDQEDIRQDVPPMKGEGDAALQANQTNDAQKYAEWQNDPSMYQGNRGS